MGGLGMCVLALVTRLGGWDNWGEAIRRNDVRSVFAVLCVVALALAACDSASDSNATQSTSSVALTTVTDASVTSSSSVVSTMTVLSDPEIAVDSFPAEPMDSTATEFGRTWNTVAQQVGVPGVVVDTVAAERKEGGGLLTTWSLMSDTVTGRLTHETSRGGGLLEVGLWPESGHDTEAGQLWLDDATRVLIQVMEPLFSRTEVEDLAARLLASAFVYEESDSTVFIYQAEDLSPFVLAAPMNPTSFKAMVPEYGDPTIQGQALPLMPLSTTVDTSSSGLAAPEVIGQNFSGEEVRMADDGRAKAIVFLAHWCPHCQVEVPKVQAWIDGGGGVDGVDIYAVATGILPDRGNFPPSAWLETEGWSTPVLRDDATNSVWTAYGQGGFPFWTFVNADGTVALRKSGEMTIEQLEGILSSLERQ